MKNMIPNEEEASQVTFHPFQLLEQENALPGTLNHSQRLTECLTTSQDQLDASRKAPEWQVLLIYFKVNLGLGSLTSISAISLVGLQGYLIFYPLVAFALIWCSSSVISIEIS